MFFKQKFKGTVAPTPEIMSRRAALTKLGLGAAIAYTAPAVLRLSEAR